MFGDADINLGGEVPLPEVEIDDDVVEEDVLIKLAWWAIIAWCAAAAWCTALHWENNDGGNESGSGFSLDEFSVYNWGSEVGGCGGMAELVSTCDNLFGAMAIAGGDILPPFEVATVGGAAGGNGVGWLRGGGANPWGGIGAPEADAANAAANAAPGNSWPAPGCPIGEGIPIGEGGGRPVIIIIALAFSAAIAAAIRLLFSASDMNGDLNRKEGSIPGGIIPYGSLQDKISHLM